MNRNYGVIVEKIDYFNNKVEYFGKRGVNVAPNDTVIRKFGEDSQDNTSLEAQLKNIAEQLLRKGKRLKVKIEITEK